MPNNPLTNQELYDYGILRSLTPPAEVVKFLFRFKIPRLRDIISIDKNFNLSIFTYINQLS